MNKEKTLLQHIREGEEKALSVVFLMIPDESLIACGDESAKFLTCQLSKVGYWRTMSVTGNKAGGFGDEDKK